MSAAEGPDDAAALVDWPYAPAAADDAALVVVAGALADGEAALVGLLLLAPQPATASASATGSAVTTGALCIGFSQVLDFGLCPENATTADSFPPHLWQPRYATGGKNVAGVQIAA